MEFLFVLLIIAAAVFIYIKSGKGFGQKKDSDSSEDNLKKYFGDDFSKIAGSNPLSQPTAPAKKNVGVSDIITPSDIINRPAAPSNNTLYGNNPLNDIINKKMAGANFLGITINIERTAEMPKNPDEKLCGLASLMLAKGMGAAAKGNIKVINFSVVSENGKNTISCSYPEKQIPETDGKIRLLTEEMGGELSSETIDGITTDKAIIPEKSN